MDGKLRGILVHHSLFLQIHIPARRISVSMSQYVSFRTFLILVIRHTISYNITSLYGPRVHLPVTYFLFRDT